MPHLKLFKEKVEEMGAEIITRPTHVFLRYGATSEAGKNFMFQLTVSMTQIEQSVCPKALARYKVTKLKNQAKEGMNQCK